MARVDISLACQLLLAQKLGFLSFAEAQRYSSIKTMQTGTSNSNQHKGSIRLAMASDGSAVSKCINEAYSKYIDRLGKKPAPMLADYSELIARQIVYVIGSELEMRAVMVLFREDNHMHLGNLAVDPDYQRRGLGLAMMRFAEELAISNGLREIRLFTNVLMTENLDYYSKIGYFEYDRRTEDGYDRVFMKKKL